MREKGEWTEKAERHGRERQKHSKISWFSSIEKRQLILMQLVKN